MYEMGWMYVPPGGGAPDLGAVLRSWIARSAGWDQRGDAFGGSTEQVDVCYSSYPVTRPASFDEVAAALVDDPTVLAGLRALDSPPGRAVEHALARMYLPAWQADLLVAAVDEAWRIARDQNRPAWQRAEVLVAAFVIIGIVVVVGLYASKVNTGRVA